MDGFEPQPQRSRIRQVFGARLLEEDVGFGSTLDETERAEAFRQVVLPCVTLTPGAWDPASFEGFEEVSGPTRGLVLTAGALTMNVAILDRDCVRLITPGDVILLDGSDSDWMPAQWGWSVLLPSRAIILDDRLLVLGQRWPKLLVELIHRAGEQTRHTLLQQAISQLPRVEDRLLALLWSMANRQGVRRSDGIWLRATVTHRTLATMVGARRPTISLGFRNLTEQGALRVEDDGWLINPDSLTQFAPGQPRTGQPNGETPGSTLPDGIDGAPLRESVKD